MHDQSRNQRIWDHRQRVADAVAVQPDMEVIGVSKTSVSAEAFVAKERGYPLYIADLSKKPAFEKVGLEVAGDVEAMIKAADIVVDATPGVSGEEPTDLRASRQEGNLPGRRGTRGRRVLVQCPRKLQRGRRAPVRPGRLVQHHRTRPDHPRHGPGLRRRAGPGGDGPAGSGPR